MKKLLVALSFIAVLAFAATPSMALVGTPDAVPGTHVLQPFFLVSVNGGLDTLVTITEVKGVASSVHWRIFDKNSNHIKNDTIGYTPHDVIPVSVRYLINKYFSTADKEKLIVNIGGDDYYMGYITWENNYAWREGNIEPGILGNLRFPFRNPNTYDNLIGHMYLVDLLGGVASGAVIPARELAQRPYVEEFSDLPFYFPGWWFTQNSAIGTIHANGTVADTQLDVEFTDYEVFTAFAYSHSKARENGFFWEQWTNGVAVDDLNVVPAYFRLLPRYFIQDADYGQTYIFVWTNGNWGNWSDVADLQEAQVYDEEENGVSNGIYLPDELNVIDMRDKLPADLSDIAPIGGWVDIRWDYTFRNSPIQNFDYPWFPSALPLATEWVAYSYQTSNSPDASLNWAALFDVHRDAGTLILPLIDWNPDIQ